MYRKMIVKKNQFHDSLGVWRWSFICCCQNCLVNYTFEWKKWENIYSKANLVLNGKTFNWNKLQYTNLYRMSLKCFEYKIVYAHTNNQTVCTSYFVPIVTKFKKENQTTQDQNIEDNLDLWPLTLPSLFL